MKLKNVLFLSVSVMYLSAHAANQTIPATYVVDGNTEKNQYRSHVTLESVVNNGCVVYVTGAADLDLTGVRMNKTAGGSTDSDREETGSNSALLVTDGSAVTVFQCDVTSHANSSYGISSIGDSSVVKVNKGKALMSKERSSAIYSSNGGTVRIDEYTINSYSKLSPAISTGHDGCVDASLVVGQTKGNASPLFSSKGDIHAVECRMEAASAPIGHIKEGGALRLEKCELTQGASCGFFISEDNGTNGRIVMEKCKLKLSDGPLLLVDNGRADAVFSGNSISFADDCLISIHGGYVGLSASKQKLRGDIVTDSICAVSLSLGKGASLAAAVNAENNAQADVRISLDKGAVWNVHDDSHVTAISFQQGVEKGAGQIKGRGNVYYKSSDPANSYLQAKEYKLGGNGMLIPE